MFLFYFVGILKIGKNDNCLPKRMGKKKTLLDHIENKKQGRKNWPIASPEPNLSLTHLPFSPVQVPT